MDQLKIDRSFIAGLEHDPVDRKIVEATIELAHMLGLRVVGEGIETPAQRERLRDLGCDLGQGFGIARPMPAGDVAGFAARWARERQAPTGAALS
ncbi:MAG: EAL domain-containing protein [Thermoleophilaceae bacterium]|nr:EAL domain-containing protein [Thermoleophilaceae bacterium]